MTLGRMGRQALVTAVVANMLVGCSFFAPQSPTTELGYKSRAVTRTDGGLRVSTVVLSADESAAVYGVPLAKQAIQPVWIEVENREEQAYFLLSPGLDPNFFPASEAAEALAPDGRSECLCAISISPYLRATSPTRIRFPSRTLRSA